MNVIAENARAIMQAKGLKHKAIAEKAGYTVKQFSDLMNDRRTMEYSDIQKIATVLDVTPNDLFGIVDENEPPSLTNPTP